MDIDNATLPHQLAVPWSTTPSFGAYCCRCLATQHTDTSCAAQRAGHRQSLFICTPASMDTDFVCPAQGLAWLSRAV